MKSIARIAKKITAFHTQISALGGFGIFVIMCVTVIDVTCRALFAKPVPGAVAFDIAILVSLVFLGLPSAQAMNSHFKVDIFTGLLPEKTRRPLDLFNLVSALIVLGVMDYFLVSYAIEMTKIGEVRWGVYALPVWPVRLVMACGVFLLLIQLVADFVLILVDEHEGSDTRDGDDKIKGL